MKSGTGIDYAYIKLCAAIVNSGIEQHDYAFLDSAWCTLLLDAVIDWHNKDTGKETYTILRG